MPQPGMPASAELASAPYRGLPYKIMKRSQLASLADRSGILNCRVSPSLRIARVIRAGVIDAKLEVVGQPKARMAKKAKKA